MGPPIVLIRTIATRQLVVAVNDVAKSSKIQPGMTLSQARAIRSDLIHDEHDPTKDEKSLEALARWMFRFSPVVSLSPVLRGESWGEGQNAGSLCKLRCKSSRLSPLTPALSPQGEREKNGIFLNLTGCDRVFGSLENLIHQISSAIKRLNISASIAAAPTPGAAWALTHSPAHQNQIVPADRLREALYPLRPITLRLPVELARTLHHLGLMSIGQLEALPRESLPARFGAILLIRLDQAFGRISEPLTPLEPFTPIEAHRDFEGPVQAIEALWLTLRDLIDQIMQELRKRGRGARTVEAEFLRDGAAALHRTIRLSRASRDAKNLFNLLRCALEDLPQQARRREGTKARSGEHYVAREGFIGIRLSVSGSEPLSEKQIGLLGADEFIMQEELDQLMERVAVRMGGDAMVQPRLVESHLPERAYAFPLSPCTHGERDRGEGVRHRPLLLLNCPREVRVMVSPSEDRDGRPIMFVDGGMIHRLNHVVGPERLAGQWWEGHDKTRDYFDVEDESGQRFWLFRVQENARWFLHGTFA